MGARVVLSLDGEIVTEVELSKAVTVVGRHPTCDICIDHPAISSRHLLFRIVNTTVYVEDLASTNGTKVNGLSTGHQVVHHLDLIEAGKHKLHFFDDAMLAGGGVGSLENTVHTDYERTMIASHAPEAAKAAARPVQAEVDLSRTMAIPRESLRQGPMHEVVRTDEAARPVEVAQPAEATPVPAGVEALALRVQSGARVGEIIALEQANTMLGTAGSDTALVVRRGSSFYLARFGGNRAPRLNHQELGPGTHRLSPGDVIEVGASAFEVMSVVR